MFLILLIFSIFTYSEQASDYAFVGNRNTKSSINSAATIRRVPVDYKPYNYGPSYFNDFVSSLGFNDGAGVPSENYYQNFFNQIYKNVKKAKNSASAINYDTAVLL